MSLIVQKLDFLAKPGTHIEALRHGLLLAACSVFDLLQGVTVQNLIALILVTLFFGTHASAQHNFKIDPLNPNVTAGAKKEFKVEAPWGQPSSATNSKGGVTIGGGAMVLNKCYTLASKHLISDSTRTSEETHALVSQLQAALTNIAIVEGFLRYLIEDDGLFVNAADKRLLQEIQEALAVMGPSAEAEISNSCFQFDKKIFRKLYVFRTYKRKSGLEYLRGAISFSQEYLKFE